MAVLGCGNLFGPSIRTHIESAMAGALTCVRTKMGDVSCESLFRFGFGFAMNVNR